MKFIPAPIYRVVCNVGRDTLIFPAISNNMIVITGLPIKTGVYFSRLNGTYTFVLIYNYAQNSWFPYFGCIGGCGSGGCRTAQIGVCRDTQIGRL